MNPTSLQRMAPLREAGYDGAQQSEPKLQVAMEARGLSFAGSSGSDGLNTQEPTRVQYTFGQYVFDPHSGELNDAQKTVQLRP